MHTSVSGAWMQSPAMCATLLSIYTINMHLHAKNNEQECTGRTFPIAFIFNVLNSLQSETEHG